MSKLNALVCGLVLAAAGSATGQEARPTELRKVSQIIGSSVLLQDGVNYGKVEDIVLNEDGCIEYVVVSREDRYALMPWGVATVDYGRRAVVFDVTPQVVQPLFFARDAWPDVADPQFSRRVQDAFGPRAVCEVRRESVRPGPDAPRPTEPPKAKVQSRPGRGPDAPPPRRPAEGQGEGEGAGCPAPRRPAEGQGEGEGEGAGCPAPRRPAEGQGEGEVRASMRSDRAGGGVGAPRASRCRKAARGPRSGARGRGKFEDPRVRGMVGRWMGSTASPTASRAWAASRRGPCSGGYVLYRRGVIFAIARRARRLQRGDPLLAPIVRDDGDEGRELAAPGAALPDRPQHGRHPQPVRLARPRAQSAGTSTPSARSWPRSASGPRPSASPSRQADLGVNPSISASPR